MTERHKTTGPAPSRADIYRAVQTLTNGFKWSAGPVARYLAGIYPDAPGPDVAGDPRNSTWAAEHMREIVDDER